MLFVLLFLLHQWFIDFVEMFYILNESALVSLCQSEAEKLGDLWNKLICLYRNTMWQKANSAHHLDQTIPMEAHQVK